MAVDKQNEIEIDFILNEVEQRRRLRENIQDDEHAFSPLNEYETPVENNAEKKLNSFFSWAETLFLSVAVAMLVMLFVFRMNVVVGESMEPTLFENDRLILFQLGYQPSYGDIVAIKANNITNQLTGEEGELIIKRIIGLEGDEIDIDSVTGVVYRNGVPLDEPYISEAIDAAHLGNVVYPVTVDENCVFVLGDNRNRSLDSRYADNGYADEYVGCVDVNYILGKAVMRIWPLDRFGVL